MMDMENTAHNPHAFKASTLKAILSPQNLAEALQRVEVNKGALGVDGMRADEVRYCIYRHFGKPGSVILPGKFRSAPVKRITTLKPEKGRFWDLGIPTVVDRFVQEAVAQVLTSYYDNVF